MEKHSRTAEGVWRFLGLRRGDSSMLSSKDKSLHHLLLSFYTVICLKLSNIPVATAHHLLLL